MLLKRQIFEKKKATFPKEKSSNSFSSIIEYEKPQETF